VVKIPPPFLDVEAALTVTPDEVEDAFVEANPGLTREGISLACGSRRLDEIRICMTRELGFRDCPEAARRTCRRDKLVMPPIRGRLTVPRIGRKPAAAAAAAAASG
jgi:ribonuclease T2